MYKVFLAIVFEVITSIEFNHGTKCKMYNQLSESEITAFEDDGRSDVESGPTLAYYADWIDKTSNQ